MSHSSYTKPSPTDEAIHNFYKRASGWTTFCSLSLLKIVPLVFVGTCVNPQACILFYFMGPAVWTCVGLQLCAGIMSLISPIPGLVLNFMSAFGFLLLGPVLWTCGSFEPINWLCIAAGIVAWPFAVFCFVMGIFDTIETFRIWVEVKQVYTHDGNQDSLLEDHIHVPH